MHRYRWTESSAACKLSPKGADGILTKRLVPGMQASKGYFVFPAATGGQGACLRHAEHGLAAGLVLVAKVSDEEVEVVRQPLGPQRVVQQELQQDAAALLADRRRLQA